jgi:ABC-type Na+ efflux pump permease subunit
VTKNAGGVDRRTLAIAAVAVAGMAAVGPLVAGQGVALDAGIYRVGVDEASPYHAPASLDPTFEVTRPDRDGLRTGRQDVYVYQQFRVDHAQSAKGRAAVSELRSTAGRYNDAVMAQEPNQSAAFPVVVNLTYREQAGQVVVPTDRRTLDGTDATGGSNGDGTDSGDDTTDGTADGSSSGGDATGDGEEASDGSASGTPGSGSGFGGSSFTARLTGGTVSGTPSDIAPPFPFRSLVLAFVFVLPLNFVIQAYGSTMLSERLNRRGELLLVAPVSRGDIIVGKTLPYFAGAVAAAAVITAAFGGSVVSVLAIMPLAALFLSATFLGAMFARSFKELTFVTVTITVSLTSYAFVPAIFTDVIPIALISPLTLVVRDLQGQAIAVGEFLFSTAPPTLTAAVIFVLGAGLYREEDMFTQRPIPLKVLDSLAGPVRGRASAAKMSVLVLPFVLVIELVVIALLFALGELSIPLVLLSVAVVEESGKSLHVYAGYAHARYDRRLGTALVVGAFSGLGFFLAEKLSLIARLVGLPDLEIGRAALNTGLVSGPLVIGFLLAPLALHVVTASISAVGASRNRRAYAAALAVAIVVHTVYNLAVVRLLVG